MLLPFSARRSEDYNYDKVKPTDQVGNDILGLESFTVHPWEAPHLGIASPGKNLTLQLNLKHEDVSSEGRTLI